jgi:hypothetical protein
VVIRVGGEDGLGTRSRAGLGFGFGRAMEQIVPLLDFERTVATQGKGEDG